MRKKVSIKTANAQNTASTQSSARTEYWDEDMGIARACEIALVVLFIVVILTLIFIPPTYTPNTDPHVGWVITESNDFGPVYRHKCEGTKLIIEHTSRGVHTPTYFENDPLCVG